MSGRFTEALLCSDLRVITEIKLRTADEEDLLATRSVEDMVRTYEEAGAPCLSVVTGRWFGGTPNLLREVTRLTELPILRKDFITKRADVEESRQLGASAVLITVGLVPKSSLLPLVTCCLRNNVTPFVEITDEEELSIVPHPEECILAVNNKNIRTREQGPGDLERSLSLLPSLVSTGTPCPVSASGINEAGTARDLLGAGFKGLLVGSALLRHRSPMEWLKNVRDAPPGYVGFGDVSMTDQGSAN